MPGCVEVLAGERLLEAEQQRFVAGVEIRGLEFGVSLEIEAAGLHKGERLGDPVGEFEVALRAARIDLEHPLVNAAEAGVAAVGQRANRIQRRSGMAVRLDQPRRIGRARLGREFRTVDDVAAIARQFLAVPLFGRRGARLGELAGDAADLHHRHRGGVGEDHRHLQEDAQEVADVVGTDVVGARVGEALGAIPALQQETLALSDLAQRGLEVASFAGEDERRIGRELPLNSLEDRKIRIFRNLHDRLAAPIIAGPSLTHRTHSLTGMAGLYTPSC